MSNKEKISLLLLIWSIVAIQTFINQHQAELLPRGLKAITAISVTGDREPEMLISGYGLFGTMELTEKIKEEMLINLAAKFGITDGYTWEEREGKGFESKVLVKRGKYADTTLQWITISGVRRQTEQYIVCEIRGQERLENEIALYHKVKQIYKEIGVEGQFGFEVTIKESGDLRESGREEIVKQMLSLMQAKEVGKLAQDGVVTVYGYIGEEDQYLKWNGKKINLQIALSYDEEHHQTNISLGIPIMNSPY